MYEELQFKRENLQINEHEDKWNNTPVLRRLIAEDLSMRMFYFVSDRDVTADEVAEFLEQRGLVKYPRS